MSFFDDEDDPFEDIVKEFFSSPETKRQRRVSDDSEVISGEEEERNIDFIETPKSFFVIFELPGYEKEDVKIEFKGNKMVVDVRKKPTEKVQPYLSKKLLHGINIVKSLPNFIKTKNYNYSFSNGVLEVSFKK